MIHTSYQYVRTFIGLPVDARVFAHFPEEIEWAGVSLTKKDKFHMTICRGDDVFALANEATGISPADAEEKLARIFNAFVEKSPIQISEFLNDFRYAKDTNEEKEAVLIRCKATHLLEFFDVLRKEFGIEIPLQPAHISLYVLEGKSGVHIPSENIMECLEKVSLPSLEGALAGLSI